MKLLRHGSGQALRHGFAWTMVIAGAFWAPSAMAEARQERPDAAAALGTAQPTRQAGDINVRTSIDRTAVWVADRVTYTVEITCRRGVDILDDDLSRDKLSLDGLELIGSETNREVGRDETTIHRFRYDLTTYRVDVPGVKIGPLSVRYYVRRPGQRLEDAAPAGEVEVPGAMIALRSTLPDDQPELMLRDGRPAAARAAVVALAQPFGIGLIVASMAPAAFWVIALVRDRRHRTVRRSVREVQRAERRSLAAVRAIDVATAEGRREAYTQINTLVRDHLRDLCGIAGLSLTPAEIGPAISGHGAGPSAEVVASLLAACDVARYAPPDSLPSAEACRAALNEAEQVLRVR